MLENMKTNKLLLIGIILIVIGFVGFAYLRFYGNLFSNDNSPTPTPEVEESMEQGTDPLNTTYLIDEEKITLIDGVSEEQIPDSSTKIVTSIWGELITTDINGNIVNNPALILLQVSGGSGSFYYVAVAVQEGLGYKGTNAIFLGDRITIQTQEILEDGIIVVNYTDRPEGAAMSEEPTVELSKYFKLDGDELVEVSTPSSE